MNLEQLNEALRFGNREMRMLKQFSNKIMIGVEYEFHVNDAGGADGGVDEDSYLELVDERADELYHEWYRDALDEFKDGYVSDYEGEIQELEDDVNAVLRFRTFANNFGLSERVSALEAVEDEDYEGVSEAQAEDLLRTLVGIRETLMENFEEMMREVDPTDWEEVEPYVEHGIVEAMQTLEAYDMLMKSDFPDFFLDHTKTHKEQILEHAEDIRDFFDNFPARTFTEIADALDEIYDLSSGSVYMVTGAARTTMRDSAEEIFDSDSGIWDEDAKREEAREQAYEDVQDRVGDVVGGSEDAVEIVTRHLHEGHFSFNTLQVSEVEQVTTDPSVNNGVELITKPLPVRRAMEVMAEIHDYITQEGSTSDRTGMHVNMSIRGLEFSRETFDPVKMIMLLDERFMRHGKTYQTGRRILKYPIRDYVDEIVMGVENLTDVADIAYEFIKGGPNELLKSFKSGVTLTNKYQSINFNNMFDYDVGRRRVEVRYFGGSGYEDRTEELERDIYQAVYVMLNAFDKSFAVPEYYQAIIRFLNRRVEHFRKRGEAIQIRSQPVDLDGVYDFPSLVEALKRHEGMQRQLP